MEPVKLDGHYCLFVNLCVRSVNLNQIHQHLNRQMFSKWTTMPLTPYRLVLILYLACQTVYDKHLMFIKKAAGGANNIHSYISQLSSH